MANNFQEQFPAVGTIFVFKSYVITGSSSMINLSSAHPYKICVIIRHSSISIINCCLSSSFDPVTNAIYISNQSQPTQDHLESNCHCLPVHFNMPLSGDIFLILVIPFLVLGRVRRAVSLYSRAYRKNITKMSQKNNPISCCRITETFGLKLFALK